MPQGESSCQRNSLYDVRKKKKQEKKKRAHLHLFSLKVTQKPLAWCRKKTRGGKKKTIKKKENS